ncbi:MAG: N-acetyltransferase [Geminicoccaceae bacterium]
MSEIRIRPAEGGDSEGIARMLTRHFEEIGDGDIHRSDAAALRRHGLGENPLFHTLVAEGPEADGRRPELGFVLCFSTFSTIRMAPGVHIQDVWVHEDARGTGLGRRLIGECARHAAFAWGAAYLTLMVYEDNAGALGFYRRLGFVQDTRDRPLHVDGTAFERLLVADTVDSNGRNRP